MATLILQGDSTGAIKAIQQVESANESLAKNMDKGKSAADKQYSAIKRIYEDSRAPAEKYKQKLEEINQWCDKHTKSEEERARMLAHVKGQYEQAGKAGEGSFGARALGQVASYAAGMVSIGAAIGAAKAALAAYNDERERAAAGSTDYRKAYGELLQVAGPEGKATAEEFFRAGAGTRAEVAPVVRELYATGQTEDLELYKQLMQTGLVGNLNDLTTGNKAFKENFKELGLTGRQLLNAEMVVAGPAPGTLDQVIKEGAPSFIQSKRLGFSPWEAMAAQSTAATMMASNPEAGTAVNSLLVHLTEINKKLGLSKQHFTSLTDNVEAIAKLEGKGKQVTGAGHAINEQRAMLGYEIIKNNLGTIRDLGAQGQAAAMGTGGNDLLSQKLRMATSDPIVAANIAALSAANSAESTNTKMLGPTADLVNAIFSTENELSQKNDVNFLSRWVTQGMQSPGLRHMYGNSDTETMLSALAGDRGVIGKPELESQVWRQVMQTPGALGGFNEANYRQRILQANPQISGAMTPEDRASFQGTNGPPVLTPHAIAVIERFVNALEKATPANRPLVPTLHRE